MLKIHLALVFLCFVGLCFFCAFFQKLFCTFGDKRKIKENKGVNNGEKELPCR